MKKHKKQIVNLNYYNNILYINDIGRRLRFLSGH